MYGIVSSTRGLSTNTATKEKVVLLLLLHSKVATLVDGAGSVDLCEEC